MIKHLLLEREKVICIIYAVFSTIISDIRDRFFFFPLFFPHFFSFTSFPYLIDAATINSMSNIYLLLNFLSYTVDLPSQSLIAAQNWFVYFFLFFFKCHKMKENIWCD